ncbi:MAG: hypothetical protein ICCCNLDF_01529 [Planctomycetes bacterium]|nr:hypothetical protein [Planctomycetota bacterium]
MMNFADLSKRFAVMAAIALAAFATACQPDEGGDSGAPAPVTFASDTLPVTTAAPGDMLAIPVQGSLGEILEGFHVRFTLNGESVSSPVFRCEAGTAIVMMPPMPEAVTSGVVVELVDIDGVVRDTHPQTLGVSAVASNLTYTRASFDAAVGNGLARLAELAVECVDTLEQEGLMPVADAAVARNALNQQVDILGSVGIFNANLDTGEMAMLQQLLDNSGYLQFLADAGGVSLAATGSQQSPLHSVWNSLIESALLKADFASLLIGEVRGALNLLAYIMNQVSGWPFIGSWAQGVASWATGLSASLQPAHELINTMIPCDLVRITSLTAGYYLNVGQSSAVNALGRFETEAAFNQQLFTTTISTYVSQAASWVTTRMSQSQVLAPYASYVQQVAALVPGWITSWLTQKGYISTSVVPGQSFTVLSIPNFSLDLAQYRFDVAGIVANLLNLPYSAINSFFNWIGINVGQPVGGYEGVGFTSSGVASYTPSTDSITAVATGNTQARYIAPMCRPASGWWAQWGFYGIKTTERLVSVKVN